MIVIINEMVITYKCDWLYIVMWLMVWLYVIVVDCYGNGGWRWWLWIMTSDDDSCLC